MTRKAELLRKMPQFKDKTVTELNDAAHEEVIADAMETILSDGTVMEDLATYDKSLWEKIKDFIVDLIKKIKKAYGELSPNSQAAKVLKDTVDDMSEIQRLWAEGVREAGERTRTAGVETSDNTSQVIFYSANEKNDSVEEQLRENQYLIQDMDPVVDITYNVVNKQRARLDASDIFREAGYKVDRQGFGIIEIGENQLSDSTRYLNNPAEFAAWMCVPKVLKRGRVISGHKNHKDRGYLSITIAAPVVINGKRGDVAVVVQQKGKNKYHVHRILMPDGSRFEYENTKNAESTGDSIVGKKANKRLSIDSASKDSISQPDDSVNKKFSISEENSSDTAYLAAVESGDMETAQKMVDEAAKAAGYKIKAYHGTNAEFTTFEYGHIGESSGVGILGDGFYFTDEKELSKQYGKRTLDCYIRIRNPYMATTGDLYNLDTITLENEGYDGVILKVPKGTIYMTFESEQIKSADPVTYDDNGNVIPLSERFKESKSDIRYSIDETTETPDVYEIEDETPLEAAARRVRERESEERGDVWTLEDEDRRRQAIKDHDHWEQAA